MIAIVHAVFCSSKRRLYRCFHVNIERLKAWWMHWEAIWICWNWVHLGNFNLFISIFTFGHLKCCQTHCQQIRLRTGGMKGWQGPCLSMRESREVSLATRAAGTSPANSHQPASSHWRNFSGNTYLMQYLPTVGLTSSKGWEGQGSKFAIKATEKICYDGKAKADGEWGWFIGTWQGKPLWPRRQICWKDHWMHWLEINLA